MDPKTKENQKTWNAVYSKFVNASALPIWGPFSIGKDLNLIPSIKGKVFLEICCGSGRSIKYLTDRGAKKVYGVDFSQKQVEGARNWNQEAIKKGKVEIIQKPMEEKLELEPIDVVFSIYGIGWTQNPKKTLSNIYSYLKLGGWFIWSWDHSFFKTVKYLEGKYVVRRSYHDEATMTGRDWEKIGCNIHLSFRKSATWHNLLVEAGFRIVGYYEPKPIDLARGCDKPQEYYSIQKARLVPASFIFKCQKD